MYPCYQGIGQRTGRPPSTTTTHILTCVFYIGSGGFSNTYNVDNQLREGHNVSIIFFHYEPKCALSCLLPHPILRLRQDRMARGERKYLWSACATGRWWEVEGGFSVNEKHSGGFI